MTGFTVRLQSFASLGISLHKLVVIQGFSHHSTRKPVVLLSRLFSINVLGDFKVGLFHSSKDKQALMLTASLDSAPNELASKRF